MNNTEMVPMVASIDIDVKSQYQPNFIDRGLSRMKDRFTVLVKGHDLRKLEKELAKLVDTADSCRAKGIERGNVRYQLIWEKADDLVCTYANKYNLNANELVNGWPAITDLKELTVPVDPHNTVKKGLLVTIAVVGLAAVLGIIGAITANIYHLFTYFTR